MSSGSGAPIWKKIVAAILDFFTIFIIGGIVIAKLFGGETEGGFELDGWPALLLFVIIIGGIYGGIFTATEAAAVCMTFAIVYGVLARKLSWSNFLESITEPPTRMLRSYSCGSYIAMARVICANARSSCSRLKYAKAA